MTCPTRCCLISFINIVNCAISYVELSMLYISGQYVVHLWTRSLRVHFWTQKSWQIVIMDATQVRRIVAYEIDAIKDALVPRIEQQQRHLQQQQGTITTLRGTVLALE